MRKCAPRKERTELAAKQREACEACVQLCDEADGNADELLTKHSALGMLGDWHHGLADLPSKVRPAEQSCRWHTVP